MDAHFHETTRLPSSQLQALIRKENGAGLLHLAVLVGLYAAALAWAFWAWGGAWWNLTAALLALGLVGCGWFACLHESGHNTAFKSLTLNKIVAFIAGLLHWYPSATFRELHFTHHRYTHVEGLDPEISLGGKPAPSVVRSFPIYAAWLTGLPLFLFKVAMTFAGALGMPEPLRRRMYPFVSAGVRGAVWLESLIVLGLYLGLAWLAWTWDARIWVVFLGHLITHLFLAFYLIMEHNGLPHEGDILHRTRSIPVPAWVRWLMWNMPYHAEHHAYPAVPFYALPALHEVLREELPNQTETHWSFHKKVLGREF